MNCKICQSSTKILFQKSILHKYQVSYHQCSDCGYIQTDEPFWLDEAYTSAITSTDIGYASRNISTSYITDAMISIFFDPESKFIDYGGGYGLFTRMMRDKGLDYYLFDKFCQNLFSIGFECNKPTEKQFELLTTFEVFEHLVDPIDEMSKMLSFSKSILFTTKLYPDNKSELENWWYLNPDAGQHISLYSLKSLQKIADKFNLNLYSDGNDIHLFTPKKINKRLFNIFCNRKIAFIYNYSLKKKRKSLLESDYLSLRANSPTL